MELPEIETEEVAKVFREYGLTEAQMQPMVSTIISNQKRWVDFMMRFELGLEQPDPARASAKRGDDCGFVHCGRAGAACAVHIDEGSDAGAVGERGRDVAGAFYFRRDQGALHGSGAVARRVADGVVGGLAAAAAFAIARLIS